MSTPETPTTEYQPRDEVADAIAGVLWNCESNCVSHGEKALLAADAAIDAARPHLSTWPTVPDRWNLGNLSAKGAWETYGECYSCSLWSKSEPSLYVVGHGTKPQDALQAAIDKVALQEADAA